MESIYKDLNNSGGARNLNLEILRIISMLMIIVGHTLGHSHVMNTATGFMWVLLNVINIMILPAVNIYVLISGYFSINAKWNIKRIFLLWFQVFFYSILFYILAWATGIAEFSLSGAVKALLPISGNQYWFARVFWCFSLFVPFVSILLRTLTKKQYQFLLIITLFIFSLWRSFLPFSTTVNVEGGNSIIWFFVLFAIAGYFRLHNNEKRKSCFWIVVFIVCSVLSIFSYFVLGFLSKSLGLGGKGISLFTEYTSITMLGMSIGLFMFFVCLPEKIMSKNIRKIIMFFSSSTYSVYLIHENKYVKLWLWETFQPMQWLGSGLFFVFLIAMVLVLYLVCTLMDFLTWKQANRLFKSCKFNRLQSKIDSYMAMGE